MKNLILLCSLLVASFNGFAQSDITLKDSVNLAHHSGGGGNGGDYIRMKFLEVGSFVLSNYKNGLEKIADKVSLDDLRATLDINVISSTDKTLLDNKGSVVDALGVVGHIKLFNGDEEKKSGWYGIFTRGDLVEKLVLHEMLRAAGVNDDNYIYSSLVLTQYDSEKFDNEYNVRWCSETADFIDSAIKQGLFAKTRVEEIKIYSDTISNIKALISPKHYYFVASIVEGASNISSTFKTDVGKVNYLKNALNQIAEEIRYIDGQLKVKSLKPTKLLGDNSKFTASYIDSALIFTLLSETREIEGKILNTVLDQVYHLMLNSDFARTKYAGIFSEIDTAKYSLSSSYKRAALKSIQGILNGK